NLALNLAVLRPSGVIATYSSDAEPEPKIPFWQLLFKDVTVRFVLVYAMPLQAHADAAAYVTDALQRGRLKHQIFNAFALADVAAADEATEAMANVGKVLVRVDCLRKRVAPALDRRAHFARFFGKRPVLALDALGSLLGQRSQALHHRGRIGEG